MTNKRGKLRHQIVRSLLVGLKIGSGVHRLETKAETGVGSTRPVVNGAITHRTSGIPIHIGITIRGTTGTALGGISTTKGIRFRRRLLPRHPKSIELMVSNTGSSRFVTLDFYDGAYGATLRIDIPSRELLEALKASDADASSSGAVHATASSSVSTNTVVDVLTRFDQQL